MSKRQPAKHPGQGLLPEPLSAIDAVRVWDEVELGEADPDEVRRALVTFLHDACALYAAVRESGASLRLPNTVGVVASRIELALASDGMTLDRAMGLTRRKGAPSGRNSGRDQWLCGRVIEAYLFAPADGTGSSAKFAHGITEAQETVAESWATRGVNFEMVKTAWNRYKGTALAIWMDSEFQKRLAGNEVAQVRFKHLLDKAGVERWGVRS